MLSAYLRLQCLSSLRLFFFRLLWFRFLSNGKISRTAIYRQNNIKKVSQRHSIFVSFGDHFCVSKVAQIDESTDFIILRVTQTGKHWNSLLNVVQINNKTEKRKKKKIVVLFIMKLHYFIYFSVFVDGLLAGFRFSCAQNSTNNMKILQEKLNAWKWTECKEYIVHCVVESGTTDTNIETNIRIKAKIEAYFLLRRKFSFLLRYKYRNGMRCSTE